MIHKIYYPPEVSSIKYCHLGEFRKEYFRLVTKIVQIEKYTRQLVKLGCKNKKHLRDSTQATVHSLAIILTMAL